MSGSRLYSQVRPRDEHFEQGIPPSHLQTTSGHPHRYVTRKLYRRFDKRHCLHADAVLSRFEGLLSIVNVDMTSAKAGYVGRAEQSRQNPDPNT